LVKDLIGCDVVTIQGQALGKLKDVWPTGANDVYVVSDGVKEVLVPALKTVVLKVDLEARRIEVDLPDGLM
jgi:16S rRNA processing protein RimM